MLDVSGEALTFVPRHTRRLEFSAVEYDTIRGTSESVVRHFGKFLDAEF